MERRRGRAVPHRRGYGALIDWMAGECLRQGCSIHLSSPVKKISWEAGQATLTTEGGRLFKGVKAIVTVPLGLLQANDALTEERIVFTPGIADQLQAAGQMGYGSVMKILLQFSACFWTKKEKKLGFILSDEVMPTWWTQFPDDNPLLTGWVPGAAMPRLTRDHGGGGHSDWTELCLSSLANIFDMNAAELRRELVAAKIVDWAGEPFIRGGYSFETMESAAARLLLNQPVRDTLYFAGEALYEGQAPATVEAALEQWKKNGLKK